MRRQRVRLFVLGCVLGITAGWGSHYFLNEATRAPRPWIAEFPDDDEDVDGWRLVDTQRLDVAKPDTVWRHHRRWFVVGREPRAKGRTVGPAEWYFIDAKSQRMVGPWRPGVRLSLHGFMPDGRYVGVSTQQADGAFRILKFDPVTGEGEDSSPDLDLGGPPGRNTRICASADCSTLAVVTATKDQPTWVRFFDVATGGLLSERTLDFTGYASGRYYRRSSGGSGMPFFYALSPDGAGFVVAQMNRYEFVRTSDAETIEKTENAFPLNGDKHGATREFSGVEFSEDGKSIYGARLASAAGREEFYRANAAQISRIAVSQVLRRVIFRDGRNVEGEVFAIDWRGGKIASGTKYVLDENRTIKTALTNRSSNVTVRTSDASGEGIAKLHLRPGYSVLNVNGIPDSQRLIVNTLHRREAREAHLPFMRSVLNALNLDPSRPVCRVEGIWQYDPDTRKWDLIRELIRKGSQIVPTRVAIQSGRIGLVMKRNGRYRFEVWSLPRYTVKWVRPAAATVGCGVLLLTLFGPQRRSSAVSTLTLSARA